MDLNQIKEEKNELNKTKSALRREIEDLKISIEADGQKLRAKRAEVNKLNKQITDLERREKKADQIVGPVAVTDHAIVRYLERKLNLDLTTIRSEIVTKELVKAVKLGNGDCNYGGVRVRNYCVVTVM